MRLYMQSSRRKFLGGVVGTGAMMTLKRPAWAFDELDPRAAAIVTSTIGIDTHNHIDVPLTAGEVPGPAIDLAGEMKRSCLSAICMTFAVDYQRLQNPGDGYDRFKNGLNSMDQQLERNRINRARNFADLRAAHEKMQPAIVQSVEGAHFLEGRLERVEEAYNRGLRHFGLLHDGDASVPLGDVYTNPPRWGGLTEFGAKVIKECNRLGMLVDLAHANAETILAALKVTTKPVIISHTGLDSRLGENAQMAQMMKPRLISKEQAKIVADARGVIGVWTHLADSPLEYAQNIRALVDVIGIDHVCIGTDTKLTPTSGGRGGSSQGFGGDPGGHRDGGAGGNGQAAPGRPPMANGSGGGPGQGRGGQRTNDAGQGETIGFYYAVVSAMLKVGFTADEIGKVGGGNFCRVFDAATTGK
jgi:membrane dipeptidase